MMPSSTYRRRLLQAATAASLPALWPGLTAAAEKYPNAPVKIVVPFGAGSGADLSVRRVSPALSATLGQPIVVDNRSGAGGLIGSEFVARAAPDGYTLLAGTMSTHAINVGVYKKLPYDPVRSFVPISRINAFPNVLVVPASLGVNSVAELVELGKRRGKPLTAATGGAGTTPHLAAEMLALATKAEVLSVPYKDTGSYLPDVISGRVDMTFANVPTVLGHVKSGQLRALAVTSAERSVLMPDVPSMAQAGVNGFVLSIWIALFAPKGTPPDVATTLNAAVQTALRDPAVRQGLQNDGSIVEMDASSAAFGTFVQAEIDRWVQVVKAAGVEPQ